MQTGQTSCLCSAGPSSTPRADSAAAPHADFALLPCWHCLPATVEAAGPLLALPACNCGGCRPPAGAAAELLEVTAHLQVNEAVVTAGIKCDAPQHRCHHIGPDEGRLGSHHQLLQRLACRTHPHTTRACGGLKAQHDSGLHPALQVPSEAVVVTCCRMCCRHVLSSCAVVIRGAAAAAGQFFGLKVWPRCCCCFPKQPMLPYQQWWPCTSCSLDAQ